MSKTLNDFFELSREDRLKQWEEDSVELKKHINRFTEKYAGYIAGFETQKFRNTTWSIHPVPDGGLFNHETPENLE